MSFVAEKNTLRYQMGARPATMRRDMAWVPCAEVASRIVEYTGPKVHADTTQDPEFAAAQFYMLNHALAEVIRRRHPDEPLGELAEVVELYHANAVQEARRMFYYLLLICTRECRHLHGSVPSGVPARVSTFIQGIRDMGSLDVAMRFRSDPPVATLGEHVLGVRRTFFGGKWGSAYGGPRWGQVTDCLAKFVTGECSADVMLDTAFTLAHNTGPIFNKGMYYTNHAGELTKILDVQRAGMMPQLVGTAPAGSKLHKLRPTWETLRGLLGDCFEGGVDWYRVEELGAVGSYGSEKAAMGPVGHGKDKLIISVVGKTKVLKKIKREGAS